MHKKDTISIESQRVTCHVGVPDEEIRHSQELAISVAMHPYTCPDPLDDDISKTIDYHAVSLLIEKVAQQKPRRLIETLAEDLTTAVLQEFPVRKITLEIKKFILPNTTSVGITITRHARD